MSDSGWVLALATVGASDLPLVGGKAANLGELARAGFRVPEGFVVPTTAYRETLAAAGLAWDADDSSRARTDNEAFAAAVSSVDLPATGARAILDAYQALGAGPVAVRSSATAEDLPGAAFAGQQETFLNVIGDESVLEAVRGCWTSLWSERAVSYRRRFSSDVDPAMAVVVQRMIPAAFAGVLFTANPVTGVRNEVVIEAGAGLGEAVVSGLITPEHVVVDAAGRIRERRAGRQDVVIHGVESGGVIHDPTPPPARTPESVLEELALVGARIGAHFGRPQDIEWAIADGTVWILQARPLTALPPAPVKVSLPRRTAAAVCAELLPTRPLPLDVTAWTLPVWFGILERMAEALPAVSVGITGMLPESRGVVTELLPPRLHPTWRTLSTPLRIHAALRGHDPARWTEDPRFAAFERRVEAMERRDATALDWAALMSVHSEVMATLHEFVDLRLDYLPGFAVSLVRLRALLTVLGAAREFWPLVSGQRTLTRAANAELEALAHEVGADVVWKQAFAALAPDELVTAVWSEDAFGPLRERLSLWLTTYGHRETTTPAMVSSPTWADNPGLLLESLRGISARPVPPADDTGPEPAVARLAQHWLVRLTHSEERVLRAAAAARDGLAFREDSHFHVLRLRPVLRAALLEAGNRLVAAGGITAVEDVFHVRLDELRRFGDPAAMDPDRLREVGDLVRARSLVRAEFGEAPLISPATLHPGVLRPAPEALAAGTPGGGGSATGPVRIIRDPSEFGRLRSGDVLVCPYTNPSWTPLFSLAAAVVADSGSFASHAAIVAREYGIPAVMGTGNGTSVLQDGTMVTVDGVRGHVVPAQGQHPHG